MLNFIKTYKSIKFEFLNPTEEMIQIEDIAHALSHQCRFNGHCSQFYSVAEHCCNCYDQAAVYLLENKEELNKFYIEDCYEEFAYNVKMWALLHDAAEAYVGDMPSPIKQNLKRFSEIEDNILEVIMKKYNLKPLDGVLKKIIKEIDLRMLATEAHEFFSDVKDWNIENIKPYKSFNYYVNDGIVNFNEIITNFINRFKGENK